MATLQVDNLRFTFKPSIAARKYDDSRHFQESWRLQGQQKAVDVVAMRRQAAPAEVWLIEAKDFRTITNPPKPANVAGLAETMDRKVKDAIAGLRDGAARASNPEEKAHAAISQIQKRPEFPGPSPSQ